METAIAAYTPNVPWARFGEPDIVDFDGDGTSAATPQVAGAAALWIQKHRADYDAYPEPWMRVEAVRKALFDGASADSARKGYFGDGKLAKDALAQRPPAAARRAARPRMTRPLPLLASGRRGPRSSRRQVAMLELELRQIMHSTGLETRPPPAMIRGRRRVSSRNFSRSRDITGTPQSTERRRRHAGVEAGRGLSAVDPPHLEMQPVLRPGAGRASAARLCLRSQLADRSADFGVNEATVSVPWEDDLHRDRSANISKWSMSIRRAGVATRRSISIILHSHGRRARAIGGQPAVPSADGLCGGHAHDRPFRAGARPQGAVGAASVRDDAAMSSKAPMLRAAAAHLSACAAQRERLLQPR